MFIKSILTLSALALTTLPTTNAFGFQIVTRYMRLHEINICEPGEPGCHPSTYEIEWITGAIPNSDYSCNGMLNEYNFGTQPYDGGVDWNELSFRGICEKGGIWMVSKVNEDKLEVWESGGHGRYFGTCEPAGRGETQCDCGAACGGPAKITDVWNCTFMCN